MKTFFAMHCLTARNKNEKFYDKELKKLGYDESKTSQKPSEVDLATGQVDESLIEKGRYQAMFLAKQLEGSGIKRIYCADQKRCKETAQIIATQLGYSCEIIVDKRLNARGYGEIAEKAMDTDKLKHFWKHKDVMSDLETMKLIAFYLLAPEKIGAEPKANFKERVKSFIHDPKLDFNNALIIGGSDIWKRIKKDNYFYVYKGEEEADLHRGQLAGIDFTKEKEVKTRKENKNSLEK
ncbi:MAG: histidine phosphatase family protein [Clostridia bacterium]|nr:histidine phosphatase family protein [Clostridia bacterium]